jgi:nitroreductase
MNFEELDRASVDYVLTTTRAVRKRLDFTRPIAPEVIEECIDIAVQAPTGLLGQTWHFLIVSEATKRAALADIYRRAVETYNLGEVVPDEYLGGVLQRDRDDLREAQLGRLFESSVYLFEHIHEVPMFVIPCIEGRMENAGPAPQASLYASILPATWSFMLALRARGLGTVLTTIHVPFEHEIAEVLNLPESLTQAAFLPVAYTVGLEFKQAKRVPGRECTHWDSWRQRR